MSRGPGRIERAVEAILIAEPDNAFTVEELCRRIYPPVGDAKRLRLAKKHRVAVLRAARHLAKRRDTLQFAHCEGTGVEIAVRTLRRHGRGDQ
jgi:hypothetical protein